MTAPAPAPTASTVDGGDAPSISIVVTTYNRAELLPVVLAPLLADATAIEIVVVVDGCDDGSLELLQELAAGDHRLRPVWTENLGMVGARRLGVECSRGEVALLLDDDVELRAGAVDAHADAHRDHNRLVAVGAMPVRDEAHQTDQDYPRVMYAREYRRHVARWERSPESVLATLWEGHLSARRDALLALKPPASAEIGRAYHCDVDFGLRCEEAGLVGVYLPQARGVHHFARTPAQFVADARSSGRGLLLVHGAHPGRLGRFDERRLTGSLPWVLRPFAVAGASRPRTRTALASTVIVLGRMRLFRPQRLAAAVLRVAEQLGEVHRRRAVVPKSSP